MQVDNNKEGVPFEYYLGLYEKMDPQEAAARTGAAFDGEAFTLRLVNAEYRLTWPKYTITADREDAFALKALPGQTFLLRWLLEGKRMPARGQFKTFREMPWGELYIKPYTGRVLTRAAFTFGTRVAAFQAACQKMGAKELSHGDAGYEFSFLPDFKVQIMVWEGDDEFPPNAQVLYSDNFETGFAPEDRVVAGDILISVIKANM